MQNNFYNNPIKLVIYGYKGLFPPYLIISEILIVLFMLLGIKFDYLNLGFFNISDYLGFSITGLSFTLAIFVAVRNLFEVEELNVLANFKGEKDKIEGQILYELLSPFSFTSMIFLITGLSSLIFPAISIEFSTDTWRLLVVLFISVFSLGLLSLFNLTNSVLNHIYHKSKRKS